MSEFGLGGRDVAASNVVRVMVPIKAFNDLDSIQRVQRDVLGQLGCEACCSGWDIRFELARQFIVDEQLNARALGPIVR